MSRRQNTLKRLEAKRAAGEAIIGAGAGTGISAKFLHAGGADLIFIYNSGRFRMQGLSSWVGHLPFGDANAIVMEMGEREIMPVVPEAEVIAGVCGFDPTRRMSHFVPRIAAAGFAGVINYPTVAVIDGRMRADLEAGNLGFDREIEMIRIAGKLDLLTTAYVCTTDEATAKAAADAAFERIAVLNGILSDYDSDTELSRLSMTSGQGKIVPVSSSLWKVLSRAQDFAELSGGAFDITVGPLVNLWRRARRMQE